MSDSRLSSTSRQLLYEEESYESEADFGRKQANGTYDKKHGSQQSSISQQACSDTTSRSSSARRSPEIHVPSTAFSRSRLVQSSRPSSQSGSPSQNDDSELRETEGIKRQREIAEIAARKPNADPNKYDMTWYNNDSHHFFQK